MQFSFLVLQSSSISTALFLRKAQTESLWYEKRHTLKPVLQGLEGFFEEAFVLILGGGLNDDVFDEPVPLFIETNLLVELLL